MVNSLKIKTDLGAATTYLLDQLKPPTCKKYFNHSYGS